MTSRFRGKIAALASGGFLFAAATCLPTTADAALFGAEVIQVDVARKPAPVEILSAIAPVTLRVAVYADSRRNAGSRKLGDIKATVMDMHGSELVLAQDLGDAVTAVIKNHFNARGFQVADDNAAAFHLTGTILDFGLNVADRDQVAIVIETTVKDGHDGKVIWSGLVTERSNRYPGVMGDSKDSIARYLNDSLATVASKTAGEVTRALKEVHPELIGLVKPLVVPPHGVSVLIAPVVHAMPAAAADMHATRFGRFAAVTTPARAKVYVGDVYYGLSPLQFELEPGVHLIRFQLEGFKPTSEKVSVRRGETTELEMTLER